jgi:hypothetical protein
VPIPGARRTDQKLADLDVAALLRDGLATASAGTRPEVEAGTRAEAGAGTRAEAARSELFADGRVAAAIAADRLAVRPRSLTFLAEVVRRGGIGYAAQLPEPLPGAERAGLARAWLAAAVGTGADEEFARWLEAVAVILGLRQHAAPPPRLP